jgi:prepilin-type N-terminal cleavage/methylation domain-containing protein
MVQYNKNRKNKKKGFTLVELMVVLAITAILAALVGGGLIAYTRLARFEKNEANARTLFQTAQISLTRMETAGELDAFRDKVTKSGSMGQHFAEGLTDANGKPLDGRTQKDLNTYIAALYYDKTGAADGNHNALVKELLGDYIYDASLLNASICVEIDVQSGQVYSVFYDTKSDKLRFNQDGATNIYDRSYDHRRNDTLVGYYSAEDRVNVVQLVQTKLKVKNPRLTNGETLTLSWSGNSSLGDLDTSYTATAYDAKDTGKTKPLFTITIKRDTAGAADDNKQVITKMPVTIYTYDNAGQRTETKKELYFPLSYNKGSFVLTLDAMADAALLRACENDEVAATSLYSITRLLNDPKDIYIAMRAEPRENYSDTYTASKEETTNEENTLLAKGGTAVTADLKYFRHLYNLRWSADWKIAGEGTYTLTPQASNSTGLNWTGGGVTVYCASGERYPAAKVPSLNDPVAWPTIPELGEKIVLTSKTTGLANNKTTRVPILNLQLSSKSVAKTGKAEKDELADHYVGLIGENNGKISYITLRDPDIQVNVKTETVDAGTLPKADQLKLTATKFVTALAKDDENWRDVRAVGALCGVNTGTLENCALTRGTNSSTSALVAAALAFDNTTTATQRIEQTPDAGSNSYTYYTDEPRGIGGLVGVAIPKAESVMQNLTVASDVTVAGLLVDENTKNVETTTAPDQQAEKARYAAAAAEPNDKNSLWRSVGVGGVFGTVDAARMKTNGDTNIVNNGFVTGNGFTGGIVGNLFTSGANTSTPSLTGLRNNGTVSAGANYKGDTAGDARSLVLGQFFGGIAGYGRGVTLQGCESVTRSDLTETQLKKQVEAGFDENGALTDTSPLKGDFVGGLVGYGKDITLEDCKTGKGYVLGSRFVGGLAGGFTGSGVHIQKNDTNSSDVFGSRYVGGIVSVNGGNSQISGMTNTGLVAAFGKNAAYVGGIVGVNDADWGGSEDKTAKATVQNCANRMSGDNATDTRRINLLKELNGCADYVGGIAGCNGKKGVVTWDRNGTPTLGAILYGNNYVGGVAGYNDENATISSTKNLTISGQIVAAGKAVGGMIGLNYASTLPSATVKVSRVAGQQLVGGVIGANLPVGGFTVTGDGAFITNVTSGRVEADAVAGGIIGYNRLLAAKPAKVTLEALLPTIDQNTGVLTDSTDANTADGEVILTGFWNKLNLQADIYVGGIVGANDANTKLTIQKATNGATQNALSVGGLNPSNNGAFKNGVSLNALAGGRYDFGTAHGALAGGIIGYATPNTTLENCINYGTVAHKCAAGGFAGWNEGTITGGSMAASLGNRETGYTYLGGVAGVNGGLIQSAYLVKDCAVRGDNYVGGIAGVNLGVDAAASTRKGLIICTENNSTGTVEANQYAGGVAGANVGNISLSGKLQSSVTATDYAGGVAGINTDKGSIYSAENTTGTVWGSVTAANYAGGVAGTNRAEITRVENHVSVRASTKYAGGIAGVNDAGSTISYCSHAQNPIYATNGEAGGIAGNNNKDALIENVQVSAAVTAANGTAGGVTATNFGTIGQETGLENNSSVSGCTITGTSESIGAVAAYNGKGATIRNVKLAENANVRFSTPAVTIGGLAGMNDGAVTGCRVENGALALNDGLRAGTNTVTLGGAVGCTTKHGTVSSTNVLLDLTQNLDKYTNLGGVAGQNDGTLERCTYSGTMGGNADTDGLVSVGARSTGSTVGGIAGLNNSTITGCEVKYIKLQVSGISNITTTQTADEKLASASHVGGIAGRNNVEIANSYVATESSSNGAGSIITARYGFVGGVAGSNNGTIKGSGSKKALVSDEEAPPALVAQVENWLGAADANAGINSMAAELTTGKTYAGLKGVDTVTDKGYTNVYSDTGLAANDLLVALRGSNNSETVRAAGYLGGLAGFNSLRGTIDTSATGQWFVYSDNATTASTVGGIVGQNESNVTDKSVLDTVVNCAAVRRFTRVNNKNDTDNDNIYKGGSRVVVHVGGVIGQQQNRSDDRWSVSKVVNCGSVFNSRSANVGGVIAYWLDYGGTVQKCFNFGKITTNTNDKNSGYGAVGGIVGFIDQPISGGTTNVLSCRNYGEIWYESNGANDCAGIIGKIEMKMRTDIMTLNIIDCVNSGAIKAESQAVGILAWIGPYNKGNIDNVTVNIDRCRNLNTDFTCGRKIGIVGSRGNGSGSKEATNVTNCFATVGTGWFPIAYLRLSGENVTGHGNYYIENSENAGKSFFKKDSRKLTTVKPNSTTGNWKKADEQGSDSVYNEIDWNKSSEKVKAHRLYIGYNVDSQTNPYIAFLPALAEGGNGAAYSLWWISGLTSAGSPAKPNSAYIKTDGKKAYIFDDTGAGQDNNPGNQRATVMLQFGEAANSKVTKDVDITDITDEVIQNYYKYVLDSTKPAKPGKINVKASQVQDADNNVYGRYEVTWDEPNDTTASPAAYYRVEILPCDAEGTVAPDADPYLKADVYQRSYTFVADKAWTGNFVVRVTPYNTNDDPEQADNPRTSGVQTFMHALPTPEIEFRLVKRKNGGFDWNQCQTPDYQGMQFNYEVVAVLKNYAEYPTDEAWTVKLTDGRYTYYFSRQNGKQYIRLTQNLERTLTLTALATPENNSTSYLRSAQYKSETYLPSQWRDNPGSAKDEDGLPLGTLKKDGDTDYVTYTGQTAESFEATVKFSFTPRVKNGSEHGSPTYRVMLLAKYLGNDEVNGVSLNGQYITLAAREGIVTGSPVTFNLNSLPSDAMTNYTDFLVVAVPVTSGKGDMKYRWDATADEVSAAIASHANDTNKEIWWKNGYEIVRTGEHSYTYAHLTPLCFSDVSRTDDPEWAEQATVTTPQIIFKQLNLNVLKAPTLDKNTEGTVDKATNELTYTFNWTQENIGTETPTYSIKLYGLLTDADGKVTGQEQIALKDTLTPTQNGSSFTLPVNVDTMLANGSDSWRYDKVRLEVTRVAAANTTEIGASAVADYSVKQRLPGISAPSSITRVNGETDNADALLYTVSWSPSDDARIGHYDLCVVDAGGKTVLTLPTTGNVGSLTLDLEQYQDAEMRFRVIARRKADNNTCFDGPDGALSQSETIVRRAAAPTVTASSFATASPNQETFLNDLKLNMTLEKAAQGNVYFTGYIFSNENNYNTIADLARTWQNTPTGQAKYTAQQKLTQALDEMLKSRDAELVIPKDSRTVGGSASADGITASYTFVPDGNGFTLTPDHAKQYLLPAVRVMPTDGTTASNWFYILQKDTEAAQLPAITLDAPVDAAEPERALGNAVYKQEVNLYSDPKFTVERDKTPLELRRFTVEWTAVNKYTQAEGTVRNLTDSYTFTVTPLDSKTKQPYSITVTTYDRDVKDADGNVTHKRGEIKTVTKTYNDITTPLDKQTTVVDKETDETRIWYDLSVEPVTDENGNVTWKSQPYDVTGTVEKDGGTLYYKAQTVPMLELVQEDGAEPVYRITLPELQEKVQDDSLALQKFTASVTLQTLAHSIGDDKTVASDSVKVTVNETNTADATEDAQSMDSAESVEPAETAESTAAESAPASVPPVLMRARAALPMATPETAAAPDETDAAETAPPKRTETSDES